MRRHEPAAKVKRQLDATLQDLTLFEATPTRAVLSARRSVKAVQAVSRLYDDSPLLQTERRVLTRVHRQLEPIRHRQVATAIGTAAVAPLPLSPIVRASLAEVTSVLLGVRVRLDSWPDPPTEKEAAARLTDSYRKARRSWAKVDQSEGSDRITQLEALHRTRKNVRRLRLQLAALDQPWEKAQRRRLNRLDSLLGHHRDMSLWADEPDENEVLLKEMATIAADLFEQKPRIFRGSLRIG